MPDDIATTDIPALDIDPFSDEFLADPYASHEALREAGPVVSPGPGERTLSKLPLPPTRFNCPRLAATSGAR